MIVTYGEKSRVERWLSAKTRAHVAAERGLPVYSITRAEQNDLIYGGYEMPMWCQAKLFWKRSNLEIKDLATLIKGRRNKMIGISREYLTDVLNNRQQNLDIVKQVIKVLSKDFSINKDCV